MGEKDGGKFPLAFRNSQVANCKAELFIYSSAYSPNGNKGYIVPIFISLTEYGAGSDIY